MERKRVNLYRVRKEEWEENEGLPKGVYKRDGVVCRRKGEPRFSERPLGKNKIIKILFLGESLLAPAEARGAVAKQNQATTACCRRLAGAVGTCIVLGRGIFFLVGAA